MVEITNQEEAEAWLKTQTHQRQVWIAARAAARALPGLGFEPDGETFEPVVFGTFRAKLISGAAGTWPTPEVSELTQALSAAAALYVVRSVDHAARSAARSAAAAAALSVAAAARYAAHSSFHAARSNTAVAARSAAYAALSKDAKSSLLWGALWHGSKMPEGLQQGWSALQDRLGQDRRVWGFWLDWYAGLLSGEPLPWPLIHKIALEVTEDDWDKGREHVADRIRQIQSDWQADTSNSGEAAPEPVAEADVVSIFRNAPVVTAAMGSLSQTFSMRLDLFDRMANTNEAIDFVETYRRIPKIAERISGAIARGGDANGAQTTLALEVGCLRAEAEQLRAQLKQALAECERLAAERDGAVADLDALQNKRWFKSAHVLVACGGVGSLIAALWAISAEDQFLQKRWNNVAEEFEFLEKKLWPEAQDHIDEPLRYELPPVDEA